MEKVFHRQDRSHARDRGGLHPRAGQARALLAAGNAGDAAESLKAFRIEAEGRDWKERRLTARILAALLELAAVQGIGGENLRGLLAAFPGESSGSDQGPRTRTQSRREGLPQYRAQSPSTPKGQS